MKEEPPKKKVQEGASTTPRVTITEPEPWERQSFRKSHSLSASKSDLDKSALFLWRRGNHSAKQKFGIFLAEVLGTAIFEFIGCSGCMQGKNGELQDTEMIAINFGFGYMVSQMLFSHISMGHFNPIISIAAVITKKLSWAELPLYLAGQLVGAFAGYTPVHFIASEYMHGIPGVGLCSAHLSLSVEVWQGVLCEFFISCVLCGFFCMAWENYKDWQDSLALTIGVLYVALTMAAVPYTGAHMNPFRSLAPSALNWHWQNHWVYWIGPILGGLTASIFYRILIRKRERRQFFIT